MQDYRIRNSRYAPCHSCESRNQRFPEIPAFAGMTAGEDSRLILRQAA